MSETRRAEDDLLVFKSHVMLVSQPVASIPMAAMVVVLLIVYSDKVGSVPNDWQATPSFIGFLFEVAILSPFGPIFLFFFMIGALMQGLAFKRISVGADYIELSKSLRSTRVLDRAGIESIGSETSWANFYGVNLYPAGQHIVFFMKDGTVVESSSRYRRHTELAKVLSNYLH